MSQSEDETKPKLGRPTKYRDEYCDMLIAHMEQGLSFESFAGVISVNQDTLHEWAKVNPIFSEAKKMAFSKCLLWWEKAGRLGLFAGSGKDKKNGNINPAIWIFNMKNRFKWSDRVEVSGGDDDAKPIMLKYKV